MSRMLMYMVGVVLVVGAMAYAALLLGVPQVWVLIGGAIVLGLGIMGAAASAHSSSRININRD